MSGTVNFMFERLGGSLDLLSRSLLDARVSGVLTSRSALAPPFALAFDADARRAGFHFMLTGSCLIVMDGAAPVLIAEGDLALLPHGARHVLADHPVTTPVAVEALAANLPPGGKLPLPFGPGDAACEVLCGAYDISHAAAVVLHGLPPLIHMRAAEAAGTPLAGLTRLLAAEASRQEPGGGLAQARLVDLILVEALRLWLKRSDGADRSWIGATADPAIGKVLAAIHAAPERSWSVATMAQLAGKSRAAFARRFHQATGEGPISYVTRLRMTDAARRLAAGARIAPVASAVGYGNEFAFAKAFKRHHGISPGAARRRQGA